MPSSGSQPSEHDLASSGQIRAHLPVMRSKSDYEYSDDLVRDFYRDLFERLGEEFEREYTRMFVEYFTVGETTVRPFPHE